MTITMTTTITRKTTMMTMATTTVTMMTTMTTTVAMVRTMTTTVTTTMKKIMTKTVTTTMTRWHRENNWAQTLKCSFRFAHLLTILQLGIHVILECMPVWLEFNIFLSVRFFYRSVLQLHWCLFVTSLYHLDLLVLIPSTFGVILMSLKIWSFRCLCRLVTTYSSEYALIVALNKTCCIILKSSNHVYV